MSEMRVQEPVEVTLQTENINVVNAVSPRIISITKVTGATEVTVEDILGIHVLSIPDGAQGETGATGATGNGIASAVLNQDYTLTLTYTDGTSYTTPSIRGAQGETGATGATGAAGYTPVKGVDYFDGEKGDKGDKGDTGEAGVGVPTGGTTGQVLAKASGTDYDTEWTDPSGGTVTDVQVNGVSVLGQDGVANVPKAGASLGVVRINSERGININDGLIFTNAASTDKIKAGTDRFAPIAPWKQHESTFYGLAKAAGDSTQSASGNAVGTYTDEAKAAIQQMLDVPSNDDIPDVPVQDVQVNGTSVLQDGVANVPVASSSNYGVTKYNASYGVSGYGSPPVAGISAASSGDVKNGTANYKPIVASRQHESTFYGLAKAAGDTTQSASSNEVGTYTESAKSKISEMLSAPVTVSGTTPTITALSGIQYVCGEVSTLDITLPESGIVDVVFTSGSTPTVLTVTPPTGGTVKWANGFDPSSLEANTTYELNIKDGLGVAVGWT